jgi:hypothetical protein
VKASRALQLLAAFVLVSAFELFSGAGSALAPPSPFSDISAGLTALDSGSVVWGDYNADGELDILLTGNRGAGATQIWKNNNGSFSEDTTADAHPGDFAHSVYYSSAAWADYDSDGDLDILVTGMNNSFVPVTKIYKNDDGVFTEDATADAGLPGVYHGSVAWGDYNADGKPDILVTGNNGSDVSPAPISKIFKNDGDGTFSEVTGANLTPVYYSSVAWGDYNNDGLPDILLTGQAYNAGPPASYPRIAKLYRNNGDGTFSEDTGAGLTPVSASSVAWGDYNSDGYPDILLTGNAASGNVSKIYKNNGNGTFSEDNTADSALRAVSYGSVAWGDYDADGRLDILLTGMSTSGDAAKLYQNNSNGTFTEDTTSDAALAGVEWSSVAWGDFGNVGNGSPDGRLDILLTGIPGTGRVSNVYQRSTTMVQNTAPNAPSGLSASSASGVETLSWSAATDSEQSGTPSGLTYNVRVGTTSGASDVVSPLALSSGRRLVPQYGNAGERTSYKLGGLTHGQTYKWSVQAVDNGFVGSAFAAEGSFLANDAPTANAGGPYTIAEGQQLQLNGSASSDFDGDTMSYLWKINGSGSFSGQSPAIPWSTLESMGLGDGSASLTASLQVTDSYGASSTSSATVTLNNAAPTASIAGPSSATVGKSGSWTFSATDPSAADQAGAFTYAIDWNGDGTVDETVNAGNSTSVSHTFTSAGSVTVKVTATDKNGGKSAQASKAVKVAKGANGKITSAKLSKKTFTAAQAKKIELTCTFKPTSKVFRYVLSLKKGTKWTVVKSVEKTGFYKVKYTLTVKQLFAGKPVKRGQYRLKLSADKNSKTLRFRVI